MNSEYFKLVITGSVNSGKTTLIRTVSEIEPITTDEWATEESVLAQKSLTTVAMDYGRRTITDDVVLHLYGTPGQARFDFMWDVLVEGAFGVIFLADSTDMESIDNTSKIVDHFRARQSLPYLLCITKLDLPDSLGYDETMQRLSHPEIIAMPCNTTDKEDVKIALITLLTLAIDEAEAETA
ncbi:MAG: ATP/GTP-binding protein [Rhizobacter sp.]|nr:ATP/GTP-binding protein [Chlorobiales bacterium]